MAPWTLKVAGPKGQEREVFITPDSTGADLLAAIKTQAAWSAPGLLRKVQALGVKC